MLDFYCACALMNSHHLVILWALLVCECTSGFGLSFFLPISWQLFISTRWAHLSFFSDVFRINSLGLLQLRYSNSQKERNHRQKQWKTCYSGIYTLFSTKITISNLLKIFNFFFRKGGKKSASLMIHGYKGFQIYSLKILSFWSFINKAYYVEFKFSVVFSTIFRNLSFKNNYVHMKSCLHHGNGRSAKCLAVPLYIYSNSHE